MYGGELNHMRSMPGRRGGGGTGLDTEIDKESEDFIVAFFVLVVFVILRE